MKQQLNWTEDSDGLTIAFPADGQDYIICPDPEDETYVTVYRNGHEIKGSPVWSIDEAKILAERDWNAA